MASTHADLFIARCVQKRYHEKKLGEPTTIWWKILGGLGIIGIVVLIAGPLLLFSTFNPIAVSNPLQSAMVRLNF